MTLLSADEARKMGHDIREQNIHDYGNSILHYIDESIRDVAENGCEHGSVTVATSIGGWNCNKFDGVIWMTAPFGHQATAVVDKVAVHMIDLGYVISSDVKDNSIVTIINW